ncbi:hypothetical protein [Kitasatospora purpeofusca]|uniref:hypothetical protein n=1 Tax=Kitasatospora purpeofusca TaxID=67352 RepID=UPI00381E0175
MTIAEQTGPCSCQHCAIRRIRVLRFADRTATALGWASGIAGALITLRAALLLHGPRPVDALPWAGVAAALFAALSAVARFRNRE